MAILATRASAVARPLAARRVQGVTPKRVVCRAEPEKGTIHFGGQEYTPEQWEAAKASGNLPVAEPVAVPATGADAPISFGSLMAFSGAAPEVINGRLAMLGVIAALGAEFASGESVFKQITEEPTGIIAAFGIFIAASFVPLLAGKGPAAESLGPFTAKAEMLNGRAAMLGFAALVAIEALKGGSALF